MKIFTKYCVFVALVIMFHSLWAAIDVQIQRYGMASFYQFGNNVPKAHAWYNRLVNDTMPPYAYPGYVSFLHSLGHSNHIYSLMPLIDKQLPTHPEVQLIFAQILEQAGKEQEAHERVIKLSRLFPRNDDISYAAAQIFIKRKEPQNAIEVIDGLLNNAPRKQNTFIFLYTKAIAYLGLDNKLLALNTIKKSLELQPNFDRGWLLYSLIEEQLGNTTEALRGYATYLQLGGKKEFIEHHVQRLKQKKSQTSDTTLKNEQKKILESFTTKHASDSSSYHLKEALARFAYLDRYKS